MPKRHYDAGTRTALISVCQGACYWPTCGEPVVVFEGRIPIMNLEMAHICAEEPGGPRYVENMTDEERNAFDNFILLCTPHHKIVDKVKRDDYSIDTLRTWKAQREAEGREALSAIKGITADELQEMIADAYGEFVERLDNALTRFEQIDSEAASLLRELRDQLMESSRPSLFPDPDVVAMLNRGAEKLSLDPDTVSTLDKAAGKLQRLTDMTEGLQDSAHQLGRVAGLLDRAGSKLSFDPDVVNTLKDAADQHLPDMVEQLRAASRDVRRSGGFM